MNQHIHIIQLTMDLSPQGEQPPHLSTQMAEHFYCIVHRDRDLKSRGSPYQIHNQMTAMVYPDIHYKLLGYLLDEYIPNLQVYFPACHQFVFVKQLLNVADSHLHSRE